MSVDYDISALVQYELSKGLFELCDRTYITNQLLDALHLDRYENVDARTMSLEAILKGILDDAVSRGVCEDDSISRDLLDTRLMGILTPYPREVRSRFAALYEENPKQATDWFYKFSQDTDYIRRYRIQKDIRWKTATEYGNLDIAINLSKPEKDPKAIAAAKALPQSGYPQCQLCVENEGYAGRIDHPARQNHRVIPVAIAGEEWYMQYSPYVYYNEQCIVFNSKHIPMSINESVFKKLLDFVTLFPHYFIGSNADLPIVGGSILSHEHFQGGSYCFPMERAVVEREVCFTGYDDIKAGLVKWPISVIRLNGPDRERLAELANKTLNCWRSYTDKSAFIYAETKGVPHNTIIPIARRRGTNYELDLVLRNNITTKENIELIEVMGLAVLPARLKDELAKLEDTILTGTELTGELSKHAEWVNELKEKYTFTEENVSAILKVEVGRVFARVLEQAGVYERTPEGVAAFMRFIDCVNQGQSRVKYSYSA